MPGCWDSKGVGFQRAFVFSSNGHDGTRRARTLRQFVQELEGLSGPTLDGYVRRADFSRWIGEVFGDQALATGLRALEACHRTGRVETQSEMADAVRARYDLLDDELEVAV
jgi:hypothetical protein